MATAPRMQRDAANLPRQVPCIDRLFRRNVLPRSRYADGIPCQPYPHNIHGRDELRTAEQRRERIRERAQTLVGVFCPYILQPTLGTPQAVAVPHSSNVSLARQKGRICFREKAENKSATQQVQHSQGASPRSAGVLEPGPRGNVPTVLKLSCPWIDWGTLA